MGSIVLFHFSACLKIFRIKNKNKKKSNDSHFGQLLLYSLTGILLACAILMHPHSFLTNNYVDLNFLISPSHSFIIFNKSREPLSI